MSDDYPAHWAPRHARERQAREQRDAAAPFAHLTSGAACISDRYTDSSDAYPSDWTPKEGEVKE
ncbi:Uncharacterised protein [Mycobacteroides abscessus subsp. abscessus]|nr:Uncharacterised protein [Mycobacteroides abscessus subsp. abscessus]SIH86579.1 Uncharacterised protein [Mycobacteroides abscessus subsp. abscessus]SII94614.1 Uncharacterised protein [Mycobacteroides abscessus subsp. abscessus]SIJ26248.1 Uncharacterised protein [Mycobacteroides abscessus subsp. abscessus]SIL37465.1 Uncharacterised protein [Mycobacteroides abscessus subsp. abscessus]